MTSYTDFVSAFGELSPYELDHLSEVMTVKLEDILDQRRVKHKMQITLQDITYALIHGMRDIKLQLAETRMSDAECQLKRAHIQTFKPEMVELPKPKRGQPRLIRREV